MQSLNHAWSRRNCAAANAYNKDYVKYGAMPTIAKPLRCGSVLKMDWTAATLALSRHACRWAVSRFGSYRRHTFRSTVRKALSCIRGDGVFRGAVRGLDAAKMVGEQACGAVCR